MKLTKTQQELYEALKAGVVVHFMPYMGGCTDSYFFRADNHKRITAAALALEKKGVAKRVGGFGRVKLCLIEAKP